MNNVKITPGNTVICVNSTDWESLKAGMLLEVGEVSGNAFKVSGHQVGNVTVLAKHADDFLRVDYVEVMSKWGHGSGESKYLCLASRMEKEIDDDFITTELAPDVLHLHGLMDSTSFRGITMKTIPRSKYVEVAASNATIDQSEWDFDISREGGRVSVNLSVLEGLSAQRHSERRLVSSVMMGSIEE